MSDTNYSSSSAEGSADSTAEVFAGLSSFILWFALFVAGAFIGTKPYRDLLAGQAGGWQKLQALFIVLFCYTATNVAMLCSISSILGGTCRRMRERQRQRLSVPSMPVLLLLLMLQGFVVYLVIAAGVISFDGPEPFFDGPTQSQYIRLASTSSLISLMIGYSPSLFNNLMGRLEKWVGREPQITNNSGQHLESF